MQNAIGPTRCATRGTTGVIMAQLRDNTGSTLTDAQIDLDEKLQTDNLVLVDDLVVVFFFMKYM